MKQKPISYATLLLCISMSALSACSGNDATETDTNSGTSAAAAKGAYFLGVKSSATSGEEFVLQTTSLTHGDLDIRQNLKELELKDYTWIFNQNIAAGFVYGYGSAGQGTVMSLESEDKPLKTLNAFRVEPRYTSYGFFDNRIITMVGGLTQDSRNDIALFTVWKIDNNGVTRESRHDIQTANLTGNGQQITFSGVADNADGTFMTAAIQSEFKDVGKGDGTSIGKLKYPDSVWVAKFDRNLKLVKMYGDDRLSFAAGRWHAQNFNQVLKTDSPDTTYVFSSAIDSTTTRKAGALRIVKSLDNFDPTYYWDLQTAFDGYKFRRVWHVYDDVYLLEYYNEKKVNNVSVAHQYVLADMSEKRLTPVTGLPAKNLIKSGEQTAGAPLYDNHKLLLPITQYGSDAAIYIIDPATGKATKGITVKGAGEIRSIGKLK